MRSFVAIAYFFVFQAAAAGASSAQAPTQNFAVYQGFDVRVPHAPALVAVGQGHRLAYELHLTSFAHSPLELEEITVVEEDTGSVLGRLAGVDLKAALNVPGASRNTSDPAIVEPGRRAVVYIDLSLAGSAPSSLRHHITFNVPGVTAPHRNGLTATGTLVNREPPLVLGPPLRGGPWVAVYEPRLERGHRRVVYATNGRATIPGRFAIDWMRPGASDGSGSDAGVDNGLGAEVLAVADGVVASTRDGVRQPALDEARPPVSLGDATGNFISLRIGQGRYVFYEHLQPRLLVKPGEYVKRGQIIGRVGSTGQASRPHLHVHLADADSPLAAEGLPYVIEGGKVEGRYESIQAFDAGMPWARARQSADVVALPAPNVVMRFPDRE